MIILNNSNKALIYLSKILYRSSNNFNKKTYLFTF